MTRVSIINSDKDCCEYLQSKINQNPYFNCSSYYTSCDEALRNLPKEKPDIVLLDIDFPSGTPASCTITALKEKLPGVIIIVLTANRKREAACCAILDGAKGYLLKDSPAAQIISIMHNAVDGVVSMSETMALKMASGEMEKPNLSSLRPSQLSCRMVAILIYLSMGDTYEEIAKKLHISINTVRTYIYRLYSELGVKNRMQAVNKGKLYGFLNIS